MKPFITPIALPDGKKLLPWQIEGGDERTLCQQLASRTIVAFRLHEGQTLTAAWSLTLIFDCHPDIEFSSACTTVDGWHESGSLNMKLLQLPDHAQDDEHGIRRPIFPPLSICGIEKITAVEEDVVAECGIAITCGDGACIIVMSGIAPGSVSVLAPFSQDEFAPEFALAWCRRTSIAGDRM